MLLVMPITDNDIVNVKSVKRTGSTNISVSIEWIDGVTGGSNGGFTLSWADAEEFKVWLNGQDFEDVMRAVLLQIYNRTNDSFRPAIFDALPGKSFRVLQSVQEM